MQRSWKRWVMAGVAFGALAGVSGAYGGRIPDNYVPKVEHPKPPTPEWGRARGEAVEVCMPEGERDYLTRLRCEDGSAPTFKRTGSVGHRNDPPESMSQEDRFAQMEPEKALKEGELDVHIIDLYVVTCAGGEDVEVYVDMYHCPQRAYPFAPEGFWVE
jgi:hypothetical protein